MSQIRPLQGFNGLRALACLSVLMYHLNQHRSVTALSEWNWDIYQFVEMWPIAVSMFFVLTAVTSSLPFWRSIIRNVPIPNISDHLIHRFFRIAPAYYMVLYFTFFLVLVVEGYSSGALLRLSAGTVFLSWLHPFTFFPVDWNGPLWYISYDMMGVLLVVCTMYVVAKVRKTYIPLIFACIAMLLIGLHIWFTRLPFPILDGVISDWFPAYNPFVFGLHFLIGIMIAGGLVYTEKKVIPHRSRIYDVLFVIVGTGLLSFLWIIREAGDFDYTLFHSPHRFPFATIPIALLVLIVPHTKYVGKWLDNHVFNVIARLSYSVYLWHAIVIVLMTRFAFSGQHDLLMMPWLGLVGTTFVGAFSLAWLSYTYIEIPVANWWRVRCEKKDMKSI